jgi:hypothetical protein
MSKLCRFIALVLLLFIIIPGCSTPPLRIQSDVVPAGSLRVAQVVIIANREQILSNPEMYKSILAIGVPDADVIDGIVAVARIYCCGGMSSEFSSEYAERRMLYVPESIDVEPGDFVEVKVGRSPENGDSGLLNTVIRVVAKEGDNPESCWWDPKNPKLWLGVPYCEWMPKEGWIKQGGLSPAWYEPAA